MPQINEFTEQATEMTVLDRFGFDQQDPTTLEWLTKKYDLPTLMGALQELFPDLFKNIFNSDGSITGVSDRTVNMSGLKLIFTNGRFLVGTTGSPSTAFQAEITGSASGIRVIGASGTGAEFNGTIAGAQFFSTSGLGVFSSAPRNVIRDDGTSIPSNVPSSILEVMSTSRGVRVFPQMSESEILSISSPANGLIAHNLDIGYPEIKHSSYGWQPIGYGIVRLIIDFSTTPITGTPIEIPTMIPIGKVIHKIISVGDNVDLSGGATAIIIGMSSSPSYFISSITSINSDAGTSIDVNSKRTTSANEDLIISSDDIVSSGRLELTIYHT